MLSVNGRDMPAPSKMKVTIFDVSSEARRSASGLSLMDRVAEKRRLDLSWAHLSGDELAYLLENVSGGFFEVRYPDPHTGGARSMSCSCSDRVMGVLRMEGGQPLWTNVEMHWIEK